MTGWRCSGSLQSNNLLLSSGNFPGCPENFKKCWRQAQAHESVASTGSQSQAQAHGTRALPGDAQLK